MTLKNSTALLILVLAGLVLMVTGCSDNEITSPDPTNVSDDYTIAEDPLEDALKALDSEPPVDPEKRCLRLADALNLDEDQLIALRDAYTVFREGIADLREQVKNEEITKEEAREAAVLLREAFEAELQLILTEEQWELIQDLRNQARVRDPQHTQNQNSIDLWGGLLEEIGADEDQIAAVVEALNVMHIGMQELRADCRDGNLTKEEAREAALALRDDFDAALQSILTEEQYLALMELRPDCEGPKHP